MRPIPNGRGNPSLRQRLDVQLLEDREVLNAVTVRLVGSTWEIQGDAAPNSIVLEPKPGDANMIRVTSYFGTKVNGGQYADIGTGRAVRISLGDGNDRVEVRNNYNLKLSMARGLTIDTGAGIDTITLSGVYVGGAVTVRTGDDRTAAGGPPAGESVVISGSNIGGLDYRSDRAIGLNSLGVTLTTIRGGMTAVGARGGSQTMTLNNSNVSGDVVVDFRSSENTYQTTRDSFTSQAGSVIGGVLDVEYAGQKGTTTLSGLTAREIRLTHSWGDDDRVSITNTTSTITTISDRFGGNDSITGTGNKLGRLSVTGFEKNTLR